MLDCLRAAIVDARDANFGLAALMADMDGLKRANDTNTRHHFESEERLMDQHGFAGAVAHRESHAHLLDDLRNCAAGCDTRSLSLTMRFLQEWLLRHIDSADRELANAVRAGGVH